MSLITNGLEIHNEYFVVLTSYLQELPARPFVVDAILKHSNVKGISTVDVVTTKPEPIKDFLWDDLVNLGDSKVVPIDVQKLLEGCSEVFRVEIESSQACRDIQPEIMKLSLDEFVDDYSIPALIFSKTRKKQD